MTGRGSRTGELERSKEDRQSGLVVNRMVVKRRRGDTRPESMEWQRTPAAAARRGEGEEGGGGENMWMSRCTGD